MANDLERIFDRIEQLAKTRGLPETIRASSYGTPGMKVKGKTFIRLKDAQTLVLMCPEEQKALLMEMAPEIYFQTDHYVGHAAILIHLDAISDDELALRLEDAWRFKAPKRVVEMKPLAGAQP